MAGGDGESEGARERVAPSSLTLWRRVSPRALRFAGDSPLEEAGFEPPVPRAAGAIETRALRRMLSDSEVDSKVKGRTI